MKGSASSRKPRRPRIGASRLVDMISYQDGSVVSKEIVRKRAGTVTLFAFDEGQGLSEHTAPFDALIQVIDGEAEVAISKRPLRLKSGQMVILPAHEPHSLMAITKFKMVLTMIRS